MKKFWEYPCRICKKQIQYCVCKYNPCPFCEAEFGFVQDWNIHLYENHPEIMTKYDSDESIENFF